MANYQNILVVIEPDKENQEALRRAVYLVKKNGGRIKAFLAVFDFTYDVTTLLSQEERMAMRQTAIDKRVEWIKHLSRYYLEAGIPIDIKVVWDNQPYRAIIEEVIAAQHDLLLKEAHQHDRLEAVIFTPIDWQLLRKCPCPVWMVKDQPWPENGKALVAVNLSSDEPEYEALNDKLINTSIELAAKLDNTELHLVGAYPEAAMSIAVELPEFNPSVYENAIRGQYLIAMKALRQKYAIGEENTHVEQGLPEQVIPQVAEEVNAGIVVIGTMGRTGLSAAFIGNTTERVIGNLKCDLLAIKPDDYESPLDDDDEDD
jgi:universal stress protein E